MPELHPFWDRPDIEGGRPFLVDADGVESRAAVVKHARERAARLRARVGSGRACLVAGPDRDGVLGVMAGFGAAPPPVLVHPALARPERDAVARRLGGRLVDAHELAAGEGAAFDRDPSSSQSSPVVVIPTSGSTGRPKGVALPARAFEAAAFASAANLGWRPDDRWLLSIPVAHVGGLSILTRCWLGGAAVALPRALRAGFRPAAFTEDVEATGATLVSLVPTMLHRLLEDDAFRWPRTIRAALIGGAAASPAALAEAYDRGWPVLATYGLTEATAQVATQPLGAPPAASGAVGPPLAGVEVRVGRGRIQVRGPTLAAGYEGADEPVVDEDGWLDTGDLGGWDERGWLVVHGRGSELIVTGGENVFPSEVERVLARHPAVVACAVVGVPDAEWGQVVGAAVVLAPGGAASDVEAFAREELASFRRPRIVRAVDALPLLPSGKPDRRATQRMLTGL